MRAERRRAGKRGQVDIIVLVEEGGIEMQQGGRLI
jgi:hypothetical protein